MVCTLTVFVLFLYHYATATNIIIQWILHMGLFIPLMALDVKRANQKRTDCCIPPFVVMTANVFKTENEPGLQSVGNFSNRFVKNYYVPVWFSFQCVTLFRHVSFGLRY